MAFIAALVVIALGGWQIVWTRGAMLADAEKDVATLSRSLAQHAARTIESVDLALTGAVEQIEDQQDPEKLARFMHRRAASLTQMLNLIVVDAEGHWTADTVAPHGPISSADRAYFQWHRDHDDRGLHIGSPVVGRTSGKNAIPLSRRVNAPDGTFNGIVVATVSPDYFEAFYKTVKTTVQGTVALWLDDGRVLARYPSLPDGKNLPQGPIASATKAFASASGIIRSPSPFDGIERITAFQHVDNYPLVVSVAVSVDDALSDWTRQALIDGVAFATAAMSLIVLGLGLERHGQRVKSFEQAVRERDGRYRILAENASDLVTLKPSFSSARSYVSPSARSMVGWEPDELKTLPTEDFIHPDDLGRVALEFATLNVDNPRITSLHRVRHKAGHHIWLESVFRLTENGDVIVAGRDVSARREIEQSLADSEARFRQLADASSDMIQQLDLSGRRVYVSPASREIFGVEAADMLRAELLEFIHPEDSACVGVLLRELTTGEREQARSIHRVRHKAGHYLWVEVQFRLVRDKSEGRPREIVSSVRDVTQREDLRQELEGANRLLLMAEEIAQVGHWRVEVPSRKSIWSREVYRIHGLDPETFSPNVETGIHLYHPEDRAEASRCISEAILDRRNYSFSLRILRPDGETRHVLSRGVCEIDSGGELTAVFGTIMDVTDLREAQRTAEDKEARYRLLADNSTDMITHMSLTGERLFVSPGSRDLLGYDPAELVGTSPHQMIHPDDAPGLRNIFDNLAAGSIDNAVNINRLRHKDGRWIWVEASLKALRGDDGKPAGLVGTIRNIMERHQANEAMRESEARYRLLADHCGDLIALKPSFQGVRAYVSPSSRSVVGYDPDEYAVLSASDLIHPEDFERVSTEYNSLNFEAPAINSVHRVRHKAGHWIWVDVDFCLTNAGQPDQSVIVRARDVSARREAELSLSASEARYRILAEATNDVIMRLGIDLKRQYVSSACERILGYTPDEMLSDPSNGYMHEDDLDDARALVCRLAAGDIDGDRAFKTYRALHKDGRWIWIEAGMNLVRDEASGAPACIICTLRDVTERQEAARHLQQAMAAAELAALAKSEFVANMSHELRTPLTGILGVHDLLSRDPSLDDNQKRLVQIAGEAGRSLLSIVNDVLDFSKIDAGQMAIETVPFDLDALVASCRDLASEALKNKPVRMLAASSPKVLGHVFGDPTRVRQVLLNLLTNAVKFTSKGEISFQTTFMAEADLLRVDITDSGIGIPANRIASLFERFTQADSTTTRRYGGTGLGLAICKRLVDLMGGRIGVDLPAGGGSHFWFELPLARHEVSVANQAPAAIESKTSSFRLLLAEDNAPNAEIIAAMLESCGHVVSIVGDGAAAVEAARSKPGFDLILMDLQMPVMDGLSATKVIRRYEMEAGTARTPIVGLTANAMTEDVERCLAVGMDAHVAKPVEWASFFAILDRLLRSPDRPSQEPTNIADVAGVLELRKLAELSSLLGRDRLAKLLAKFVGDLPSKLALAASGGSDVLAGHTHTLLSTSGQFGFHELSALCAEINHEARTGAGLNRLPDLMRAGERAIEAASRSGFADVA